MEKKETVNKHRNGGSIFVSIIHALGTWTIAGISIWAIWWSDFGEQTASLLKTEIVEQKAEVATLKRKAEELQNLLESKESNLAKFEQESALWEQKIQGYKEQTQQLQADIEQYELQVVSELLRKWAVEAGRWMKGHKIRAEVAAKWNDHKSWMGILHNWDGYSNNIDDAPYIWNLGLIHEKDRGKWSIRMHTNCVKEEDKNNEFKAGSPEGMSRVQKWLQCGQEFENEFMKAITYHELNGIYTVRDLRRELQDAFASESQNWQVTKRFKVRLNEVLEEHGVVDDLLLRVSVRSGSKSSEIINAGEEVLGNFRIFESALTALKEDDILY